MIYNKGMLREFWCKSVFESYHLEA